MNAVELTLGEQHDLEQLDASSERLGAARHRPERCRASEKPTALVVWSVQFSLDDLQQLRHVLVLVDAVAVGGGSRSASDDHRGGNRRHDLRSMQPSALASSLNGEQPNGTKPPTHSAGTWPPTPRASVLHPTTVTQVLVGRAGIATDRRLGGLSRQSCLRS